jgi:hypothetical protein
MEFRAASEFLDHPTALLEKLVEKIDVSIVSAEIQ